MFLKLNDYQKIRAFSILAYKIPWRTDILLKQDKYIIDARKSLGILSLDLEQDLELIFMNCSEEDITSYLLLFESFESK